MVLGVWEVVHDEGVLCSIVTPGSAVTAIHTWILADAYVIHAAWQVFEVHVNGNTIKRQIEMLGGFFQRHHLCQPRIVFRIRTRLQHVFSLVVILAQGPEFPSILVTLPPTA